MTCLLVKSPSINVWESIYDFNCRNCLKWTKAEVSGLSLIWCEELLSKRCRPCIMSSSLWVLISSNCKWHINASCHWSVWFWILKICKVVMPLPLSVRVQYCGPGCWGAVRALCGVAGFWAWPEKELGCNSKMFLHHLYYHGKLFVSYPCPGNRVQSYFGFWWPYHQQTISAGSQVHTICAVFVSKDSLGRLIAQLSVPHGLLMWHLARWLTLSSKSLWITFTSSLNVGWGSQPSLSRTTQCYLSWMGTSYKQRVAPSGAALANVWQSAHCGKFIQFGNIHGKIYKQLYKDLDEDVAQE